MSQDISNTPFINDFLTALSAVLDDYQDIRVVDYSKITYSSVNNTSGSTQLSKVFASKGCIVPQSFVHTDGSSYYVKFKTPSTQDMDTTTIIRCEGYLCAEYIGNQIVGWDFGNSRQFATPALSANTTYILKATLNSNAVLWSYKPENASSFTPFGTSAYNSSLYGYDMGIGVSMWGNHLGNPFKGEIYLDDCYAEDSNGNEFWRARVTE